MGDLAASLSAMAGRWVIGGPALDEAPDAWRNAVDGDPSVEVALLALAGQASQVALRPAPGNTLKPLPELPRLDMPPLARALRPRFRQIIAEKGRSDDETRGLIELLFQRGATIHPGDHMPKDFEGLPAIYAPWAGWKKRTGPAANEKITEDNFDAWMPAERRHALVALRQADPDGARAILEACAALLPADQRLGVVETLGTGLSPADATYLQALQGDRSGKVAELATRLLARLGLAEDGPEDLAEFAAFFSAGKKGFIRRSGTVTSNKLKTGAQRARRRALADKVTVGGFARALGLDATSLIDAWDGDTDATQLLVEMVAATGNDEAVSALAARILRDEANSLVVAPLAARLPLAARRDLLPQIIARDSADLVGSYAWAHGMAGSVPLSQIKGSGPFSALIEAAKPRADEERYKNDHQLRSGLFRLGVLADQNAARSLIDSFTSAGMLAADPALAVLTLNAALSPETSHDR